MKQLFFIFLILVAVVIPSQTAWATTIVHFSPKGGCEQEVVHLIAETHGQLDIAVYSLNNEAILQALNGAKIRGVKIRILTDHTQAAVNAKATTALYQKGFDLRLHSVGRIMHNKYAVFDGKKIVTGSFNWTNPAERVNEENCLVLSDPETVAQYEHQFTDHLWVVNTAARGRRYLDKILARTRQQQHPAGKSSGDSPGGSQ